MLSEVERMDKHSENFNKEAENKRSKNVVTELKNT